MYFNDQSFEQAERNLAWDEACVELADRRALTEPNLDFELLRVWKFPKPTVVLGRASRVADEIFVDRCEQDGIGVYRRSSGGSTIIAGPGCLMYSVLISYEKRPAWRPLDAAHHEVMSRIARATSRALSDLGLAEEIQLQGTCDLTWNEAKFSGNALRCKRQFMLYHGTLLIDMPLDWVSTYLKEPPRQPEYRSKRNHEAFVRNLLSQNSPQRSLLETKLIDHLRETWQAATPWNEFPWQEAFDQEIEHWIQTRYSKREWNFER